MNLRETSIEAYNEIKRSGLLSRVRWMVYDTLYQYGPLTGAELDAKLKSGGGRGHYHKRLPELRDIGVVMEVGERRCNVTNNRVIEWDVTGRTPIKLTPSRPPSTKKQLAEAMAEIERLKRKVANLQEQCDYCTAP